MKLKSYLIIILIFSLNNLYSQSDKIEIYNEMFKWKFSIPNYFENVSPKEAEKNQAIGKEIIEKKVGQEIVNKSIKIYGFKSGNFNQLIVNYQFTKSEDNYTERFKQVSELLYQSFKEKLPNAEIKKSYSSEIISNIKFDTFEMHISDNKIKMNMKCFSAIIDGKILNIQIAYQDEEKGEVLISSIRKSTFIE
mgnify:FL=1|jgi:hypothetical protein